MNKVVSLHAHSNETPMREKSSNQKFAEEILHKMGIRGKINLDKFWRKAIADHGSNAQKLYETIQLRASGIGQNPYPLKNASILLANAIASQYDSSRIESFITWFLNENFPLCGSILEVGCDNGILTCALATKFKDVTFVGIDPCAEAIHLAQERATALGLTNCEFKIETIDGYAEVCSSGKFTMVLAMTVAHEILANGNIEKDKGLMAIPTPDFCLHGHDKNWQGDKEKIPLFESFYRLLSDDGTLISVDRWNSGSHLLKWIRFAEKSGFILDINKSTVLEVETEKKECFPVTLFKKGVGDRIAIGDALALASFRKFPNKGVIHASDSNAAELIFCSLSAEDIFEINFTYNNGSGILRIKYGLAQGVGYIYKTTSIGYRELLLFPSVCMREFLAHTRAERADLKNVAKANIGYLDQTISRRLQIDIKSILESEGFST